MIKIVVNCSPLIFLSKIGRLDLLRDYTVYIPIQVVREVAKGKEKNREGVLLLEEFFRRENVTKKKVEIFPTLPNNLGEGEQAVISLAAKEGIPLILVDERKARIVARLHNLNPKGTLWILKEAQKKGMIGSEIVEELTFELVQKGYRIKEEILIEFLKSITFNLSDS